MANGPANVIVRSPCRIVIGVGATAWAWALPGAVAPAVVAPASETAPMQATTARFRSFISLLLLRSVRGEGSVRKAGGARIRAKRRRRLRRRCARRWRPQAAD